MVAVSLVAAKLWAWLASGSVGVLASLADSSLDLLASMIAATGVWFSARPADDNHRFGHEKGEAAAALVQAVLIGVSVIFIATETINAFLAPEPLTAEGVAMLVMAGSLAATIILVSIQTIALRRDASLAVEADRAHYVGDILSQGGVLAALAATTYLGAPRLDAIAGAAVGVMLAIAAATIARKALRDLLDEELPDAERDAICKAARGASKALGAHDLRTRRAGERLFVQLHLDLPAEMALREAHAAGERARAAILKLHPGADVIIHHDPV